MSMLKSLSITNFRCFPKYHMPGLARVNLLVGKNNSGKTALLEAVHFLVEGGAVWPLVSAARRRGELVEGESRSGVKPIEISHAFYGRSIELGSRFSIEADPSSGLSVEAKAGELGENFRQLDFFDRELATEAFAELHISSNNEKRNGSYLILPNGALITRRRVSLRPQDMSSSLDKNVVFIPPYTLPTSDLAEMWDYVIENRLEGKVASSLGFIAPGLEDVFFKSTISRDALERAGVMVGLGGEAKRIPLGSMGDGVWRLLALSLSLQYASESTVLIDEVDAGLHYSSMTEMWELLIGESTKNRLQVFATTHSNDCLQALGSLCESKPELAAEVAVHKLNAGFDTSVPISGLELPSILYGGAEIR